MPTGFWSFWNSWPTSLCLLTTSLKILSIPTEKESDHLSGSNKKQCSPYIVFCLCSMLLVTTILKKSEIISSNITLTYCVFYLAHHQKNTRSFHGKIKSTEIKHEWGAFWSFWHQLSSFPKITLGSWKIDWRSSGGWLEETHLTLLSPA